MKKNMEEKETPQDGGVQPTEKIESEVNANATPAIEESVDEDDLSEYGVPPMPIEEEEKREEEEGEKPTVTPLEKSDDTPNEEAEVPRIDPPEPRTNRLDRRLAQIYIQNCLMEGDENVPTEEQILADLRSYSREDKMNSLNQHLAHRKRLRGERPTENNFEEEDIEAIRDAERESIRQEILAEENEMRTQTNFVKFMDSHPELIPENNEYDPRLAKAVETLWRGGMPIKEAFETVTDSISSVKANEKREAEIMKQRALSGAISASNDSSRGTKSMTWTEFDKLRTTDPARYERLLDEGYEPIDDEE